MEEKTAAANTPPQSDINKYLHKSLLLSRL